MTHAAKFPLVSAVRRRGAEERARSCAELSLSASCRAVQAGARHPSPPVIVALIAALALLGGSQMELAALVEAWQLLLAGSCLAIALAATTRRRSNAAVPSAPRTLGPYTLGEKIGEGGMGVVYKARHAFLERPTAIKLLRPSRANSQDIRRFEREVQLTSKLTHPNTISVYDFGRSAQGAFYYAMEYLDGLDLQTLVERDGPQEPARVAHVLAQLCGALAEAHGIGLIHRDIKPANVVICERGGAADVVKVLDFGLIKEFERPRTELSHSDVQAIVGTPLYLSPEALTAPDTMDGRSDLYAVGALGYFLLTGAPPFSGGGLLEVCAHHLHTAPVPPSKRGCSCPPELEVLILSCLSKSMAARPVSAAALREALIPLAAAWSDGRAANFWVHEKARAVEPSRCVA